MNKSVLITGVAGMIGSHLLDALMEDTETDKVYGIDDLSVGRPENIQSHIDKPKFEFFEGGILDEEFLNSLPEVGMIVHLAAVKKIGESNPGVENLRTNGIGSENIFKLALKLKSKVILGSTSDCYGMSPDLPFKEEGDLLIGPSMIKRWSYAVGKLYAEQLAFAYYKDYKLPVVVLRYFGGFSERASFSWSGGHIPIFIDAVLKNEECPIHGDGLQTRSMTHVSNLVKGTYLAMKSPAAIGELINIGEDREMSVLESAQLIHRFSGSQKELKLKFIPTENIFGKYKDICRRVPDLSKARKLLGYKPEMSLEDGVKIVLKARKEHLGMDA
jgi:UDP-glucose 4-epimerase